MHIDSVRSVPIYGPTFDEVSSDRMLRIRGVTRAKAVTPAKHESCDSALSSLHKGSSTWPLRVTAKHMILLTVLRGASCARPNDATKVVE